MNRGLERPPAKLAGSIQVTGVKETGPPKARGSGAARALRRSPLKRLARVWDQSGSLIARDSAYRDITRAPSPGK